MNYIISKLKDIYKNNIKHLIKFSIVGVSNTVIDFFAFSLFYSVFGMDCILSQVLGYSVGILNSFIFNRKWTFGTSGKLSRKTVNEFIQFITINFISLGASVLAMGLFVEYANMSVFLSKILVIVIPQIINFLSYKLWVFAPAKSVAE